MYLMWNGEPVIEPAPKPDPHPPTPLAKWPPNQTPITVLAAAVVKVTSICTELLPQFWKQVVAGECVGNDTTAAPVIPPTCITRVGGVSLLLTASKGSDGIVADVPG